MLYVKVYSEISVLQKFSVKFHHLLKLVINKIEMSMISR